MIMRLRSIQRSRCINFDVMSAIGASPSWSTLFRPPNRNRRRELSRSPEEGTAPSVRRVVSNSPFIGPPSWLFQNRPISGDTSVSSKTHHQPRTPFLTIALLKLHETLPEFCMILGHNPHTQQTASKACALLDTSVATSTTPVRNLLRSAPKEPPVQETSARASRTQGTARSRARSQSPVRRRRANEHHEASNNNTINASFTKRNPVWYSPGALTRARGSSNATSTPATPLLQWLTSSTSHNQAPNKPVQHPSAVAIENEWDYHVAPFLLLTAALVFQADLQHCQAKSAGMLLLLPALYHRIATDLLQVKATLCAPVMGMTSTLPAVDQSPTSPQKDTSPHRRSMNAAGSLSRWLQSLATYCTLRAQLAELQASLFACHNEPLALREAGQHVTLLLQSISSSQAAVSEDDIVQPMFDALLEECKVWKYSLEACHALQNCQFCETILLLHKWKVVNHTANDTTRVSVFFRSAFNNMLALLPVYFDRIDAFAGSLYGFDTTKLMQGNAIAPMKDWNSDVLEFLKRQERGGGPATAVAIVLDALRTNNLHVERGLQLNASEEHKMKDAEDPRVRSPAVYLRSTLYLGSPAPPNRAQARFEKESTPGAHSSQNHLLPQWRKVDSTSPSMRNMTSRKVPTETTVGTREYDASWPNSDWENLVLLLHPNPLVNSMTAGLTDISRMNLEIVQPPNAPSDQNVVTFRVEPYESKLNRLRNSVVDGAANFFDVGGYNISSPKSPFNRKTATAGSSVRPETPGTFHVASLSDAMHLVVMVKSEGEQRWNRRRNQLTDEEIREFLNNMAASLRVSEQFSPRSIPKQGEVRVSLEKYQLKLPLDSDDGAIVWSDANVDSLLKAIKDEFGLRPTQEGGTIVSRNSPGRFRFSPSHKPRPSRRDSHRSEASIESSVAVFFMGNELATIVSP